MSILLTDINICNFEVYILMFRFGIGLHLWYSALLFGLYAPLYNLSGKRKEEEKSKMMGELNFTSFFTTYFTWFVFKKEIFPLL